MGFFVTCKKCGKFKTTNSEGKKKSLCVKCIQNKT